jgi:hypothetical protein
MTHDELLAHIERYEKSAKTGFTPGAFTALYAVVKLHKPLENSPYCEACLRSDGEYPCNTIQAIEESLVPRMPKIYWRKEENER